MEGRYIFVILFLLRAATSQSSAQPLYSATDTLPADSIVYEPGYFRWNENTVITIKNAPASQILEYQETLDHTNTVFDEDPESLVIIEIGAVDPDRFAYVIGISQDTIWVTARSENDIKTALQHLHKMKMNAEKDSPDYGLIYLECGIYWRRNF